LAIVSLVLLVSCTTTTAPPASSPELPRWSARDSAELPAKLASRYVRAAIGWNGGLLVGAEYPEPALFASPDGSQWTEQAPEGFDKYLRGQPFAAYGPTAFVLGSGLGEVVVWRTEDGTTWERAALPDSDREDPFMAIAAGPHGVLVVGSDWFDYNAGLEAEHTPDDFFGFEFWHSADGRSFRYAGTLSLARDVGGVFPRVVATEDGFLLHNFDSGTVFDDDTPVFRSTDGAAWESTGDGLPTGSRLAAGRAGDLIFVLGQDVNGRLFARHRRDGDSTWSSGVIDLGRMPDAGVVPRDQQRPILVHPWGSGFMAVGGTTGATNVGVVWTSPDGVTWTRMPVRDNGFDQVVKLMAVASSRGVTYLFGVTDHPPAQRVRLWQAAHP
jgi:hypothetical protein